MSSATTAKKNGQKRTAAAAATSAATEEECAQPTAATKKPRGEAAASSSSSSESCSAAAASSAATAASSSSRSSSFAVDLDSLGVVLSFLGTSDFLSAIRVCCHWRNARTKKAAWHTVLNVEGIIAEEVTAFDPRAATTPTPSSPPESLHTRLHVRSPSRRVLVLESAAQCRPAVVNSVVAPSSMWRHVADLALGPRLCSGGGGGGGMGAVVAGLLGAGGLQSLTALTLEGGGDTTAAVISGIYTVLAPRLQSLTLSNCVAPFLQEVGRLTSLRALCLDVCPAPEALVLLKQLVHLRLEPFVKSHGQPTPGVEYAVRWLSTFHALRSLHMRLYTANSQLSKAWVGALLAHEAPKSAAAVALITNLRLEPPMDWRRPCGLTSLSDGAADRASRALLLAAGLDDRLPTLTSLCWNQSTARSGSTDALLPSAWSPTRPSLSPSVGSCLSRLQVLSIVFTGRVDPPAKFAQRVAHLSQCSTLRSIHLAARNDNAIKPLLDSFIPVALLQRLLAAWAATIEEIRIKPSIQIEQIEGGATETIARTGEETSDAMAAAAGSSAAAAASAASAAAESSFLRSGLSSGRVGVYDSTWRSLSACHRLRTLELPLESDTPVGMMQALGSLPVFHTLVLSWAANKPQQPLAPVGVLAAMCASKSWTSLRLLSRCDTLPISICEIVGVGLPRSSCVKPDLSRGWNQQLKDLKVDDHGSAAAYRRLRLYAQREDRPEDVECFRIAADEKPAAGLMWLRD